MFNSEARIWVVYLWTIASNIGLVIGPIMSSYIIEALDWSVSSPPLLYSILLTGSPGDGSFTSTQLPWELSLGFSALSGSHDAP